jgi:hypothetical protein
VFAEKGLTMIRRRRGPSRLGHMLTMRALEKAMSNAVAHMDALNRENAALVECLLFCEAHLFGRPQVRKHIRKVLEKR